MRQSVHSCRALLRVGSIAVNFIIGSKTLATLYANTPSCPRGAGRLEGRHVDTMHLYSGIVVTRLTGGRPGGNRQQHAAMLVLDRWGYTDDETPEDKYVL